MWLRQYLLAMQFPRNARIVVHQSLKNGSTQFTMEILAYRAWLSNHRSLGTVAVVSHHSQEGRPCGDTVHSACCLIRFTFAENNIASAGCTLSRASISPASCFELESVLICPLSYSSTQTSDLLFREMCKMGKLDGAVVYVNTLLSHHTNGLEQCIGGLHQWLKKPTI